LGGCAVEKIDHFGFVLPKYRMMKKHGIAS